MILAIAMTSNINIGVRHVLPIYAPLAIAAAVAIRVRWLNVVLIAWLVIGSALAHPDYLAVVQRLRGERAAPHSQRQQSRLGTGRAAAGASTREGKDPEHHDLAGLSAPLDRIGLPPRKELQALQPVHGWLAISELNIALGRDYSPEVRRWLDELLANRPYRRVGKTIRLYYFE